jgi:serine/threonine protein phosphatase PrpC
VEWGVATATLPGQVTSGDNHLVCPTSEGALVAVVDGLGHGEEAARASRKAISELAQNAEEHVISLVRRCQESLRPTRGVVMSLAAFNARASVMTWIGVGNVTGMLLRSNGEPQEALLLRGGVVGSLLPPLQAAVLPLTPGDTLVLATDGVQGDFLRDVNPSLPPQAHAERILARYAKGTDDALLLIVRFKGGGR